MCFPGMTKLHAMVSFEAFVKITILPDRRKNMNIEIPNLFLVFNMIFNMFNTRDKFRISKHVASMCYSRYATVASGVV